MKTGAHAIGMLALGVAALAAAGVLYDSRVMTALPDAARPLDSAGAVGTAGSATGEAPNSLAPILGGVASALEFFATTLEDRRSDAVRALDAAYRLSDVLRFAASGGQRTVLFERVTRIRTALQNGRAATARQWADEASSLASTLVLAPAPRPDPRQFDGATVLGPSGRIVGTVIDVRDGTLRIESGGLRNVLGFMTFVPGNRRDVSPSALTFGAPRAVGMTLIVDRSLE